MTALEVGLELWLALTVSPVAKLMRHSRTPASALLQVQGRGKEEEEGRGRGARSRKGGGLLGGDGKGDGV